ncbi:MAG: class I SAM-dependent methyltransferase [Vitreimonas sp.]
MSLLNVVREKLRSNRIQRFMARVSQDNIAFDRVHGTDTAGKIDLDAYDISEDQKSGAEHYQGVHEGVLRIIIDAVAPHPEEFDFIDIGSGKGKALIVASTYPFKRVRGVEISQNLTAAATRNIETFAKSGAVRCTDVSAICQDAREVSGFGDRTFVFFLNPFHDEPMEGVVKRLEQVVSSPGKSMIVTYLTPNYRAPLDASRSFSTLFDTYRLVVYATPGEGISDEARAKLTRTFTKWQI